MNIACMQTSTLNFAAQFRAAKRAAAHPLVNWHCVTAPTFACLCARMYLSRRVLTKHKLASQPASQSLTLCAIRPSICMFAHLTRLPLLLLDLAAVSYSERAACHAHLVPACRLSCRSGADRPSWRLALRGSC
jgi:hypothetical protein